MEHLVKQNVFDGVAGHARMVKDAADDNRVVCGIVVAETAAGVVPAPGQLRLSHQAVEKASIEILKDFFEMIVVAAGGVDVFASTHLPHQASLGCYVVTGDVAPIAGIVDAVDRLAIKLGEQDVRDRMQYRVRRTFEQIR